MYCIFIHSWLAGFERADFATLGGSHPILPGMPSRRYEDLVAGKSLKANKILLIITIGAESGTFVGPVDLTGSADDIGIPLFPVLSLLISVF